MFPPARSTRWTLLCVLAVLPAFAQQPATDSQQLTESGRIDVAGQNVPYLIRRLPLNAFPGLPENVVDELNRRQCLIPQSYQAHHPENVVHASLEHPGSSDWAVLCSANGEVSLLVFFGDSPSNPVELARVAETKRLEPHNPGGELGFDWAIDLASPEAVHQAQSALEHKPPKIDHDALADHVVDRRTIYRFFSKGSWRVLDMP